MKMNLPVLLLRSVVLFPYSEIRIEFDRLEEKQLLSLAEAYYEGHLLVVIPEDPLEEDPDILELPKVGVIGQIKMKMDMPNGKTRVIIRGEKRALVDTFTKEDDLFEATLFNQEEEAVDANKETAYVRTLMHELDEYIKEVPKSSNSGFSSFRGVDSIHQLTDLVALFLPSSFNRKIEYILEMNPFKRAEMILDDMHHDIEIVKLEQELDLRLSKELDDQQKEFVLREKIRLIKQELGDINDKDQEVEDLRNKILKLKCNEKIQKRLLVEVSKYEATNPNSPEMGMIKNYIDWFLDLPWNVFTKDKTNLKEVKESLDKTHYGLEVVKTRILEYLAVSEHTNHLKSPILCLVGPPGVGKTTLAKSIAESLGRKCTKISVGGVNDEAEIVGHRRTYVGAAPGLIIQGMKKAGTSNPVFIIDEIDKLRKDIKGDPASALLEVLDKEQNKTFVDHYIEEEYDLSHVLFITTANYLDQIPEALRDRLEIVELSSYTEYEKQDIAINHLIPLALDEHGLTKENVTFNPKVILTIIRNYTKEAGVRELERLIAMILRKVVMEKVTSNKNKFVIDDKNVEQYLGKKKFTYSESDKEGSVGVVNGLAYTIYGGDLLPIEATMFKGKGNLILTGSLGDVMKESARLSFSYIKAHTDAFLINPKVLEQNDIHIHVPEGAIPKDGPSAGVTLTTTLISLFTNTKISNRIAMTGEMTLRGKVLPIGGLREKAIGAHRGGVRKIFIPRENAKDLDDIPDEIKKDITFVLVDSYIDIYHALFRTPVKKGSAVNERIITTTISK